MCSFTINESEQQVITPNGVSLKLRPQSLDVFRVLLKHSNQIVSKDTIMDEVWQNTHVTDDSLIQCIAEIRRQLGEEHRNLLVTFPKKGYRLTNNIAQKAQVPKEAETSELKDTKSDSTAHDELNNSQKIRFCTTRDGVKIAYSTLGKGSPVVFVANWLTHLNYDLKFPARRKLVEMLMPNFTVVRYDARGNGLSQLNVEDLSLEASILDLETIVDQLGLDNISLIGQSQGAAIAAAYAARNKDRVNKLVVYGGYARGRRKRGSAGQISESEAFETMIREGWGREISAYVQMFGTFFMPDGNQDQLAGFINFQRVATPPENAARIQRAIDEFDISDELENISAPTLILHVRDDARVSFEEGKQLASAIPNAQFVPLEGRNHALLAGEPALEQYILEIKKFLNE